MVNTPGSTTSLQKMQWLQGHLAADQLCAGTARACIDLNALVHNYQVVRQRCPQQKVMAMVKSRAYGHGLVHCALALVNAGVNGLGVACLGEALALREAGISTPIFLISGFHQPGDIAAVVEHDLIPVLHSAWQIDALLAHDFAKPVEVWMKLDSGMGRMGFRPEDFMENYTRLTKFKSLKGDIGVITHLAAADDVDDPMTPEQIACYWRLVKDLPGPKSIANSAGILHWPKAVADTDWVRPGIMLYGASPELDGEGADFDLKPVMTLSAQVISVKAMQAGDPVGYSHTWHCPEAMNVAALAIGYGDGLARTAAGLTLMNKGQTAEIVGRVSMDLTTIDCRSMPDIKAGDRVILWGQGGQSITAAARQINAFHYEMLTGVSGRVARDYVGL